MSSEDKYKDNSLRNKATQKLDKAKQILNDKIEIAKEKKGKKTIKNK
jgi:hypothetical protein